MRFLSDAWIHHYREALRDADTGVGSCLVQYLCEEPERPAVAHFQEFEDGRLTQWEFGVHPEHPFAIIQGARDMEAMLTGTPEGNALLERTWIQEYRDGTAVRFHPPPLDERTRGMTELPLIPNASLTVQAWIEDSPFGDLSCAGRTEDGRVTEWVLGALEDADIVLAGPYEVYTRHRAGLITMSEGFVEGRVSYDDLSAALLAMGLRDGPEYRAVLHEECCRDALVPLGILGEIVTSPVYQGALARANATYLASAER